MKEVDLVRNRLVVAGKGWEYERSPCCKDMIHHLVRRECYCSWFQPVDGGVKDQFPAIRIGDLYYTLSLRIQKAMFRHVRLTKDFKNLERLPDGQVKLRIPTQLLVEKKRTATRFTVMRSKAMATKPSAKRLRFDRRGEGSDVMDLSDIINGILGPASEDARPSFTVFSLSEEETAEHIMQNLFKECPSLTEDKMKFMRSMGLMYEKIHSGSV
ncbi:hypothetical protein GUITHDRAFT_118775 [Guillardia theta CCMP2712]|uniref:Uncharacterized protein n=1 Tax=Guillardia theta (strain CCMP2712) TaxID=905079 RepID=L1IFJ0_GUITC|nr:hypothetical protein GUITHDRAFT_118775 [Guillardia theta CCMP2712]EKX35026.1 hypothetical protein GUITHDRAFT_118775 [Guillardia theta CCMP2712]|eukprot:XP_005822006.1 hypothetical protein GUITHDRAFT_118775 [Guillardia theta CCMP2712]